MRARIGRILLFCLCGLFLVTGSAARGQDIREASRKAAQEREGHDRDREAEADPGDEREREPRVKPVRGDAGAALEADREEKVDRQRLRGGLGN